jgi:transposase
MLALHRDLDVVIGVDTRKDTHTAAAVGASGAVLEHLTVPADLAGYRQLIAFGARHDATLWAIEGTGSFGAGLTTALLSCCERIVEVDRPQRPARRGGVKSDTIDAVRAARQALAGYASASRAAAKTEKPSGCCWPPARRRSRSGPGPSRRCMHWSPARLTLFGSGSARCRWASCSTPAPGCATRRAEASRSPPPCWRCGPSHAGRSPVSGRPSNSRCSSTGWSVGSPRAARPVGSWPCRGRSGHHLLVPSRPHPFRGCLRQARRCCAHRGVVGHRHPAPTNRSGDRQLNRALHTTVLVRMRQDTATKDYVQRRLAQGKTIRDIKRCLKRYIARQLFRQLEVFRQLEALSSTT